MSRLFPGGSALTAVDFLALAAAAAAMFMPAWKAPAVHRGGDDFFAAGKTLAWPAAAVSLFASEVSALALLSLVASTYGGDWSGVRLFAAAVVARACLVWLYLPIVYPACGATVYGYLDARFGPATRRAASGLFVGMRLLASGARLATGAAVGGAMLGVHPRLMIFALAVLCALYTARGGLRAVSRAAWAQTALIAAAPLLVLAAASKHWPGGWAGALQAARDAGRLGLGKPADAVTLAPAFFAALATYGADQELAQNALAASSVKKARLAMAAAVAASLTVGLAYLAAGTGLFAFYKLNPGMTAPSAPGLALPHFVLTSLPAGARGLAAAALLMAAAHLPLCSLSAAAVEDFYRPWLAPKQSEAHYLRVSKGAVWFFAAALCALALLWNESEAWLAFLLKLGSMLLGPLLGFFLFALFSRRWADRANVIAAAVTAGLGAVLVALAEAGRARFDLSWLIVGGALLTAILARQLAPYLGER